LCLGGFFIFIFADYYTGKLDETDSNHNNPLVGDAFVIIGAFLYALSNVLQEHHVKNYSSSWYLFYVGLFGSIFGVIQILTLELENIKGLTSITSESVWYIVGFQFCLLFLYVFSPFFLKNSSSVTFNLSLLTSDFFGVLLGYFLFSQQLTFIYLIGFIFILTGLVLYEIYVWKSYEIIN
jgi:solute carrier family 35 protein F1/2